MVRDLHYEQLNTIYDEGYQENRIKCKNYELCQDTLPLEHYAQYLCITCDNGSSGFGWNELEFRIRSRVILLILYIFYHFCQLLLYCKARNELKWNPKYTFNDLVKEMVEEDCK